MTIYKPGFSRFLRLYDHRRRFASHLSSLSARLAHPQSTPNRLLIA
jgi:hypothetical protein